MVTLTDIVENKRREVHELKKNYSFEKLMDQIGTRDEIRNFKDAIKRKPCNGNKINIIAEIKLKSPTGEWKRKVDHTKLAKLYEKSGASAISVITDKKFFGGDIKFIPEVKKYTTKPILRKEFIIDEYQIYESLIYGADAVLLMASILTDSEIKNFVEIIRELKMSCLVECHTEEEIERINKINELLENEIEIYGINNRNLETMEIDLNTTKELIKKIPTGKIVVSESGIKTGEDIKFIKNSGASAALIGTSIMLSDDVIGIIDNLLRNN